MNASPSVPSQPPPAREPSQSPNQSKHQPLPNAGAQQHQPFRLSLQLPEKKRLKLQEHEQRQQNEKQQDGRKRSFGEMSQNPNPYDQFPTPSMPSNTGGSPYPSQPNNYFATPSSSGFSHRPSTSSSSSAYPYDASGQMTPGTTMLLTEIASAQQAGFGDLGASAMYNGMQSSTLGGNGQPMPPPGGGGGAEQGTMNSGGGAAGTAPGGVDMSASNSGQGKEPSKEVGAADPETFEFMKRKKWPQLLMQELVGAAVWCLVPYTGRKLAKRSKGCGWKIVFASPATHELLGYRPEEIEGLDWGDVILASDLPRLVESMDASIAATETPWASSKHKYRLSNSRTSSSLGDEDASPAAGLGGFSGPSKSMSVYTRMAAKDGAASLFELRGHAYFGDEEDESSPASETNGGFEGGGVMAVAPSAIQGRARRRSRSDDQSCKAFWVMGRKWTGSGEGGGKMLDTFLELKMENERLKQELRELHANPPKPVKQEERGGGGGSGGVEAANSSSRVAMSDSDSSSEEDEPSSKPQQPSGEKKPRKSKNTKPPEYLCRNCGRNDSPEWRKGPLGPKTLCNACGLRWAKRNAPPPPKRKDEKDPIPDHQQAAFMTTFTGMDT